MSRSYQPVELLPGTEVEFANDGDTLTGTVNGAPWVWFDGTNAVAYVPVHVRDGDRCFQVAGANIICTRTPRAIELAASYGYSERV
jgi:hypothetical protein